MSASRIEAELKFLAADDEPLRRLEGMDRLGPAELGPSATASELDRYLDSEDLRLAAARWACRLRTRDGRTIVSLKGPAQHESGDAVHRRPELEGPATPSLDPLAWPPSEARDFLRGRVKDAVLNERFRLEQERTERTVMVHGVRVGTLSLDRVRVLRHRLDLGRLLVVELELQPAAVNDPAVAELASALSSMPGLTNDPLSKLERAVAMLDATG